METADDRKRVEGTPAELPVNDRPEDVTQEFARDSVPTMLTWLFGIMGAVGVALGAMMFVPPVMIVGAVALIVAAWIYFGSHKKPNPRGY